MGSALVLILRRSLTWKRNFNMRLERRSAIKKRKWLFLRWTWRRLMHLHLGKVLTWLFLYSYLLFVCMKTDSSQVLKAFHSQKSSTDRSLRPIVSDVQQLVPPQLVGIKGEQISQCFGRLGGKASSWLKVSTLLGAESSTSYSCYFKRRSSLSDLGLDVFWFQLSMPGIGTEMIR